VIEISGTEFPRGAAGYEVAALQEAGNPLLGAESPLWDAASVIEWGPAPYRTRFRASWDREALHVRFDAEDSVPWHTMTRRDDHIWEEEVVELFLDADGSGQHYAELEISPANVVCDLDVVTAWPNLESRTGWDWEGLTSAVHPWRGPGAGPGGWTAVARLPWAGLRSLYAGSGRVALPPARGAAWRFNVFRIKRPEGPARPGDRVVYAAWSKPAGPSFHDPAAFRPLTFL
jgi:hypothetical protein